MRALICGLNGAGSALGSPNGLCAAVRSDNTATDAIMTAPTMPAMTGPRMSFASSFARLSRVALDTLQRAFRLDRDLRIAARRGTSDDAQLLVARLVAGDLDVFGIDLLAEAWNFVGAEKVGARNDAAAIFYSHGHLGIGDGGAARVPDETEIGRPFLFAIIVIIAEARTSSPRGERNGTGYRQDRACHPSNTPNRGTHQALLELRRPSPGRRRDILAGKERRQIVCQDGKCPDRNEPCPPRPQPLLPSGGREKADSGGR